MDISSVGEYHNKNPRTAVSFHFFTPTQISKSIFTFRVRARVGERGGGEDTISVAFSVADPETSERGGQET